ncbi:MAG: class I SAM-dependent methyltransferase, partial [Cyanobacteria bacterium J06628_3]
QFINACFLNNDLIRRARAVINLPYSSFQKVIVMYLSKQQVTQLFDKLIENFSGSLFAFDSVS